MNTNKEASETQLKKAEDVAEVALTSLLAAEQEPKSEDFSFPRTVVHNRWNIMDKIGSGGFGAIYRGMLRLFPGFALVCFAPDSPPARHSLTHSHSAAFDPQTKKKVAIKVVRSRGPIICSWRSGVVPC
jgi:hypothetical protein